jgi:hypothetical protein
MALSTTLRRQLDMATTSKKLNSYATRLAGGANDRQMVRAPLLTQVTVEHGPVDLLGRFLLQAEHASRIRGVTLSLEPIEALGEFTRAHLPTWPPLPMFDPAPNAFPAGRALCLLGRDAAGRVVATQAVRGYRWSNTSLRRECEALRIFYGASAPPAEAACTVSAPSADSIRGRVAYSGGGWYDPEFRGRELSAILPRISRALALTLWDTNFTVSFVDWRLVEKGVVARYGYRTIEDGIRFQGIVGDAFHGAVVWMHRATLLQDLEDFLASFDASSSGAAKYRRADQKVSRA